MSGTGSEPTEILVLIFLLVGLPLSARYSLATLRGLNQQGSGSSSGRRVRQALVVLALLGRTRLEAERLGGGLHEGQEDVLDSFPVPGILDTIGHRPIVAEAGA